MSGLCASCGLCCNGVLFGNVRLQSDDKPALLKKAGLPIQKSGQGFRFAQPCACLHGTLCRIYGEHPAHCRAFECRVVQRLKTGQISMQKAHDLILRTKNQVAVVEAILSTLGDTAVHLPLNKRYGKALASPLDLSDPKAGKLRGKLLREVGKLAELLRNFLD